MASPKQLHSLINDKIEKAQHDMYTGMPGKIVSYDAATQSCTAQPVFQTGELPMPPIYHVPVLFPEGGGAVMTFPVKAGDKCWLSFSMYPLDEYINGSGDTAAENSMARPHDYNECVAYVGMGTRTQNSNPDPDKVMIRFGKTKMTLDDQGEVNITGKLIVSDTITGKDFVSSTLGVSFNQHRHHYFWTDPGGDADSETPS